jgi:predicted transcriptional regulator
MEDVLAQAGLNDPQAKTYLYLLANGQSAPPTIAGALSLTRSNAYKVLEKLLELKLISRAEVKGKFVYKAEDPIALAAVVAAETNRVRQLQQGINNAMHQLRQQYQQSSHETTLQSYHGNEMVVTLYQAQAETGKTIYSVGARSSATLAAPRNVEHQLLTDNYMSPVEWTVSGDELLIISFEHEASAIRIKNALVAQAFKELWHMLDNVQRQAPGYKNVRKQARRKV